MHKHGLEREGAGRPSMGAGLAKAVESLVLSAGVGVWNWSLKENEVELTPQLEAMVGYGPGELSRAFEARKTLVYPEDAPRREALLERCKAGELEHFEITYRMVCKDGATKWLQEHAAATAWDENGRVAGLSGIVTDVTKQKEAEQAGRARQKQREYVAHLAGLAGWDWDVQRDSLSFDDDYIGLLGRNPAEMAGPLAQIFELVHEDDRALMEQALMDFLANRDEVFTFQFRMKHMDGHYLWLLNMASVVQRDAKGQPLAVRGGVLNIDKTVRAEEQLRQVLAEKESDNQTLQQRMLRTAEKLEITRKASTALLEGSPHINMLFSDKLEVLACNPASVEYFGFASKEDLQQNFMSKVSGYIPEFQAGGRKSASIDELYRSAVTDGYRALETELFINGERRPLNVVFKKIPYEEGFAVVAYLVDLRPLHRVNEELVQQDRLLRTINEVAAKLINVDPDAFDYSVWESMKDIAQVVNADRMYIWENFIQDGKLYCTQTYEWSEGAEPQQGKDFTIDMDYDDVPFWRQSVLEGSTINSPVEDLPPQEREILEMQGCRSVLVIPIFNGGMAWGFIGFDDCSQKRVYSEAEENTLRSGGNILVSALLRNKAIQSTLNMQREVLGQDRLLRAVNHVAESLMSDTGDGLYGGVIDALQTLGESVQADRAYIWRNNLVGGEIYATPVAEWAKDTPSNYGGELPSIRYSETYPQWKDSLHQSLKLKASQMGESITSVPGAKDVKSLLLLPLLLAGEFWGFIGFDNLHKERDYSPTEEDILHSGGIIIAAAIARGEMTDRLIDAKEDALASMKAKTEFLSRMSHEIRTPMNAIIGMTAIAQKSEDPEKMAYCLDRIGTSSGQLLDIINDVLDMSKIEANKFEIMEEEFNFESMMENVFNVVQVKIEEKQQDFLFDLTKAFTRNVVSDELRLSQVLTNLLSNAVKFTPVGGTITLHARTEQDNGRGARLHVEVSDSGIGIAPERISGLFTSFEQGDGSITREYGGSGLGLAICKKIVDLMGGRIWVRSELGGGSTFYFEVDIQWGSEIKEDRLDRVLRKDLRILLADDMPDVREYFKNIVESFDLTCDAVENGALAVEMVKEARQEKRPYHIVFLDLNMPVMDGGQAAAEIRACEGNDVVVVLISVADWTDVHDIVQQSGVDRFMPKPLLPSALHRVLLDLTEVDIPEAQDDEEALPDWSEKCILLVEDIEINREIVMSILEETHVGVECACNGEEGVEMFSADPARYDLILMDMQMPKLDGLGATRQIRALAAPRAQEVPIVAMTANAFKEDARACIAAGMNAHLAKPIDVDEMFATLTTYIR